MHNEYSHQAFMALVRLIEGTLGIAIIDRRLIGHSNHCWAFVVGGGGGGVGSSVMISTTGLRYLKRSTERVILESIVRSLTCFSRSLVRSQSADLILYRSRVFQRRSRE